MSLADGIKRLLFQNGVNQKAQNDSGGSKSYHSEYVGQEGFDDIENLISTKERPIAQEQ